MYSSRSLEEHSAYYVYSQKILIDNIQLWFSLFPQIHPYYAVKCNNYRPLIDTMTTFGVGFDCASLEEINLVSEFSQKIIYANPIKFSSHLRVIKHKNLMMTADCVDELVKIAHYYPQGHILLRIAVDDSQSVCRFNSKFGLIPQVDNLSHFFSTAKQLSLNIVGISFHVGSGCQSADCYSTALRMVKECFDFALQYQYQLSIVDIGGGFSTQQPLITHIAETVNQTLSQLFDLKNITVIAEPGRFMAANAFDLYVTVIGKKVTFQESINKTSPTSPPANNGCDEVGVTGEDLLCESPLSSTKTIKYYVNNGVYGEFNCKIFDHVQFQFECLPVVPPISSKTYPSTIFGPTCDSMDVIIENVDMQELCLGDKICFKNMGAYTRVASTAFNGIPVAKVTHE